VCLVTFLLAYTVLQKSAGRNECDNLHSELE
jgi:hypothetical protein